MSNLSAYLAQAVGPVVGETLHTSSATITVDDEVFALVILGGAGGSGGISVDGGASDNKLATGGNAGGVVIKLIRMKTGVDYALVINTGGAGKTLGADGAANGNAGGNVTFISNDSIHSITALGGNGGNASVEIADGTPFSIAAPTALSGTGGHNHYDGGQGGSIDVDDIDATDANQWATGGGGVNMRGAIAGLCDGGLINVVDTGTITVGEMATGGGGVGARGGDITGTLDTNPGVSTGGGSAYNSGVDAANPSGLTATAGGAVGSDGDNQMGHWMQPNGAGGAGATSGDAVDGGDGAGGGAARGGAAGDGGIFGGGGATTDNGGSGDEGDGGLGAGGGGATNTGSATSASSGAGGDGWAVVRLFAISRNIR